MRKKKKETPPPESEHKTNGHADPGNPLELRLEKLKTDVANHLIAHVVRPLDKPFAKMDERGQEDVIRNVMHCADMIVRRSALLISEQGFPHVLGTMGKFSVDEKGIEIKFKSNATVENITAIATHGRSAAVLVLAEVEGFMGSIEDYPKPERDQPVLPMEASAA